MKVFTKYLLTLLLLGIASVVNASEYEIDQKFTSVDALDGQLFAIVNETDAKAIYNVNNQNLAYDSYSSAVAGSAYLWKLHSLANEGVAELENAYAIEAVKADGSSQSLWGQSPLYLNSGAEGGFDGCFVLGNGTQYGTDVLYGGAWEIEYEANVGFALKNVARGGYFAGVNPAPTAADPIYFTFCTLKKVEPAEPVVPLFNDGTYYLLNQATNKYLAAGSSWGTHAVVNQKGLDYILTFNDGQYTIDSQVSNGGNSHFLNGEWNDGAAFDWTFTEVAEGVYTISSGTQYLTVDGEEVLFADLAPNEYAKWTLVSAESRKNEVLAAMQNASVDNPVDISFLIKAADFNRNDLRNNSWIRSKSGGNMTVAGPNGNLGNYGCEFWNNTFEIYQTIEDLPSGVYELTFDGFGTNGTSVLFIGGTEGAFLNTEGASNFQAALEAIANGEYTGNTTGPVTFVGGDMTFGVRRTSQVSADWTVIDNARLFYYGAASLDTYRTAWEQALEAAQAALASEDYEIVEGVERTNLEAAVDQYSQVAETQEAYEEAASALINLTNIFKAAQAAYLEFGDAQTQLAACEFRYPYASEEKLAAAMEVGQMTIESAEQAQTMAAQLLVLCRQVAESSALLEGVEGSRILTGLIQNPNAEDGTNGWELILGDGSGGNVSIMSNEPLTDASGNSDYRYFDGLSWGSDYWDGSFQQAITLPAGKYLLTVSGRASSDVMMSVFAGEDEEMIFGEGNTGGLYGRGWNDVSVEFELDEESTINIGVHGEASIIHQWMSFTRFRLAQFEGGEVGPVDQYVTAYNEALAAAIEALENEDYSIVEGSERIYLENTINQYNNVEGSQAAYEEAINALASATNAYIDAVPAYLAFGDAQTQLAACEILYPYASEEKLAAAMEVGQMTIETADQAQTMAVQLLMLCRQVAESSALLEGVEGSRDLTELILNPNAENGTNGWEFVADEYTTGNVSIMSNEPLTDASGNSDYRYFDGLNWGSDYWNGALQQAITLPAGKYLLTVSGRASSDVMMSVFAGEDEEMIFGEGNTGGLFGNGWNDASVEFELDEESTINIGVRGEASSIHQWMSFTRFRLAQFEGESGPIIEEEDYTEFIQNAGFDNDLTWQADGSKKEIVESVVLSDRSIAAIAVDNSLYATVNPGTPKSRPDGRTFDATNGFVGQVDGWTLETSAQYPNCEWVYFGTLPYDLNNDIIPVADDGSGYLTVPARPAEFADADNTGFTYMRAGWGSRAVYKQVVEVPCAQYRLEYWAINLNANANKGKNLSKVTCRLAEYPDETGFSETEWTKHTIEFTPTSEFTIQFGFEAGNASSNINPFLCIDGIKLYKIGEANAVQLLEADLLAIKDELSIVAERLYEQGYAEMGDRVSEYMLYIDSVIANADQEEMEQTLKDAIDLLSEANAEFFPYDPGVEAPSGWVSLIDNNDLEGDVNHNFFTSLYNQGLFNSNINDGDGVDGSRGIKIEVGDRVSETWENQFWVRLNEPLPAGTQFRMSFDYRADNPAVVSTMAYAEPGDYIHWALLGDLQFDTNWQTFAYEGTVTSDMSREDKMFQSAGFLLSTMADANNYYFDNLYFEIYQEGSKAEFACDVIQLDFGFETNLPELVKNSGKRRLIYPKNSVKVTIDGEVLKASDITSVEGFADGRFYVFLEEMIDDDATVEVMFKNPVDDTYRIFYTSGKYEGQAVSYNGDAIYDDDVAMGEDAFAFIYVTPVIAESYPVADAINLPNDIKEFTVVFDKPVECSALEATLDNMRLQVVSSEEFDERVVLVLNNEQDLVDGEYTITINKVYPEARLSDDIYGTYTYNIYIGSVQFDPEAKPEIVLSDELWDATPMGGIPEGYIVEFNGELRTYESTYGSGPRMFVFPEGGDFTHGLYFREGYTQYGGEENYPLYLEAGKKYTINFKSAMWKENGSTMNFRILPADEDNVVFEQTINNSPNVNGNTGAAVLNATNTTIAFTPENDGYYMLRWQVNGFSEVLLANPTVKHTPSSLREEVVAFFDALENAKQMRDVSADCTENEEYITLNDLINWAEAEYQNFISFSQFAEVADNLNTATKNMKEYRKLYLEYTPLVENMLAMYQQYADTKFTQSYVYDALGWIIDEYAPNGEIRDQYNLYYLSNAYNSVKEVVTLAQDMFTEGPSRVTMTGYAVLTDRIRQGAETMRTLGIDNENLLWYADNTLDEDDWVVDEMKQSIKNDIYNKLSQPNNDLFDGVIDEATGEEITPAYNMNIYVDNPNIYKWGGNNYDFSVPGWYVEDAGMSTGWTTYESWDVPADAMFQNWGGYFFTAQSIGDLPAGTYTVKFAVGERVEDTYTDSYAYVWTNNDGYTASIDYIGQTFPEFSTNNGIVTIENVVVTDGWMQIGVEAGSGSHLFFNEVQLLLTGPAPGYDYNDGSMFLMGDVNLDGEVTTSDAVATVGIVLEDWEPTYRQFRAADVNYTGNITVSDVVGVVNIALNGYEWYEELARSQSFEQEINYLTQDGNKIGLKNTTEFVAFQMDVTLTDGAMLNGVNLNQRANGLNIRYSRLEGNTYRIMAFSMNMAAITGNEGELLSLDITGNQTVTLSNIEFTDTAARAYALGVNDATGINGIMAGDANADYYTVDGVKNDKMRKGMNVVKTADGKVRKMFVK